MDVRNKIQNEVISQVATSLEVSKKKKKRDRLTRRILPKCTPLEEVYSRTARQSD